MLEWSSGFPYFLQFKSEFCNKKFMIWATVSSRSCFCWLYRASPSLAAKNIISLISVLTIWWCPCAESSLVCNHRQENVGSHQKKIPHVQGQRRSPITARAARKVQTNFVCTRSRRPHRDWARSVFECLLQRSGSAVACRRGRSSGCSRPGCAMSPLGGGQH